ncbi:LytR/AlgR family response regulator transcription factor [Dyella acidiphila]|uniref:LytTR family transcriptional regulator DNA-binding domain-containing protein n=1 Tax=Dyella acidiphila TaxID=2775866 RepID=A0ABR9G4V6_9GAMM|nr:LytTR family transcriptional regulator DNA-binding domain-containing protein [Dyella acidiphila]MBE1159086.1 LytTR family transcriptional regulator DNA-binding domain-containing protein [Dyella acidiphila]
MSAPRMRALLVDDEVLARLAVRQALAVHTDIDVVGECGNVQEARQAIAALAPDLVFLDIQMPGGSGFKLLGNGHASEALPLVVFTTAFADHALRAFDANAIDYVLKPIDQLRFDQAMDRVRRHWRGLQDVTQVSVADSGKSYLKRISVQVAERSTVIPVAEIDWIRADDNYVRIHAGGHAYLHRETLRHLCEALDPNHFLRIHRSIVVNMDRIREVHTLFQGHAEVVLHDGTRLDLSRRFRHAARAALGLR